MGKEKEEEPKRGWKDDNVIENGNDPKEGAIINDGVSKEKRSVSFAPPNVLPDDETITSTNTTTTTTTSLMTTISSGNGEDSTPHQPIDLETALDPIAEDAGGEATEDRRRQSPIDKEAELKEAWFKGIAIGGVILLAVILSFVMVLGKRK